MRLRQQTLQHPSLGPVDLLRHLLTAIVGNNIRDSMAPDQLYVPRIRSSGCNAQVLTNLISTRWCYCNQLSAPAPLLLSTALLPQKLWKLLICFSPRSGWVSLSHQWKWQWTVRCRWPWWSVQSLQRACLPAVSCQRETGALHGMARKLNNTKKEPF